MVAISLSRSVGQIMAYLFSAACAYFDVGITVPFVIAAICAVMTCVALLFVVRIAFSKPDVCIVKRILKKEDKLIAIGALLKLLGTSGAMIFMIPAIFHGMLKDGVNTWVSTILRDTFQASASLSTILAVILPLTGLFGVVFANFLLGRKALFCNHPLIGIIIMLLTALPTALLLNTKGITLIAGVICLCLISFFMESFNHFFSVMMPTKFAASGKATTVSGSSTLSYTLAVPFPHILWVLWQNE